MVRVHVGICFPAAVFSAMTLAWTASRQQVAIFRRLVLLKFVNIGLTVLVTNSRRVINMLEISLDYEEDFTSEW